MEQRKNAPSGLLGFFGARGRMWLLLGGLICGIFLILLGSSMQESEQYTPSTPVQDLDALQSYQQELEKEIAALCDEVSGIGQTDVMIHLKGGTRVLYATDEKGKPVLVGSGSSEQALPSTVLAPEIAGVGVVCRGGNSPAAQQKLISLISTTLGIPTNRVSVTGK